MRILLVEPNYRTTFPPLGLLRISAFLKSIGIVPTFVRGKDKHLADQKWDWIFISSLFTFELPRTVQTINYYQNSVENPNEQIIVGGVGATLMPDHIRNNAKCRIITGPLCQPNILGLGEPAIATFTPDYDILKTIDKIYKPEDAYFTRVSIGCIRKCGFCAVPLLEPNFSYLQSLSEQVNDAGSKYGVKKDLIILDNNILALENIENILAEIKNLGFHKGALIKKKRRIVDFNQGIDVRLITPRIARLLGEIAVDPVRIAFDHISVEKKYREGVRLLAEHGITNLMTYVMFNYNDTPEDFYRRLQINLELSNEYNIRITGFPMRYAPISDIDRHFVSKYWNWRYLRGIQCILNATHGIVSPNQNFFNISFGKSFEEFKKIISMPDRYIIYRKKYEVEAMNWFAEFSKLTDIDQCNFIHQLGAIHNNDLQLSQENNENFIVLQKHYFN